MVNVYNQITIVMTHEQIAERLLWPLWRCVDADYKRKYARDIWNQFEGAIKSSAYTSNLRVFLANIQQRLQITIETQFVEDIAFVIQSGMDEEILTDLREETTYLVLLVRLKNETKKQDYENLHNGGSRDGSLFDQP